ncbi:MAG: AmmeMemoRadiSam system protein B [Desulfobacterota bacterium]|nr:AmmeMemoRadiSam system protein B [Thermodesulfobacteriota bacterium]
MSGETLVCLQDPFHISDKTLFLPPSLFFVVSLFDGRHSILDIQAEYLRRFGELLYREKIEELIHQLDETLFLEGERFEQVQRQIEQAFREAPVREAIFAGKSYERDPGRLKAQLSSYFTDPDGPGPLSKGEEKRKVKGVIAPHIDFQRGGTCYAFAHRELWNSPLPDCFVLFGTAHGPMDQPFALTRKTFLTPLGPLEVDRELIEAIQSRYPEDLFRNEGAHRTEHSIEFQCVFLRYLFPEPTPLRIVPILSGSVHEAIEKGISPWELMPVRKFLEALSESVASLKREVCYLASADLAHVGPQFGDPEGIGEGGLYLLERADLEMLGQAERMEAEGFYSTVAREGDRRRICGLPAIYGMLKVMEAEKGRLLKYGQAYTPETKSVVTFASLVFYGGGA